MSKKRIFLLIIVVLMISSLVLNTKAFASDAGIQGLFPKLETLEVDSQEVKMFDKYPVSRYMFDTKKFGILEVWATALTAITNVLFLLVAYISYAVNYLLMACFSFNIFKIISSVFDQIIWALRDSIFTPLATPILAIVAVGIIFNVAIGRVGNAWRLIINTLVVLVISFAFFKSPSMTIELVNDASQSISGEVLASTSRVATGSKMTSDDAIVNLGNVFWDGVVVKPWQLIQFGSIETGTSEEGNFLPYDYGSDTRKDNANRLVKTNSMFDTTGAVVRLVMVIFISIIVLALDIFMLIIAVLTVALQFAAVLSAMIMVVAFIISLLPNMGSRVAIHSLINTFTFLLAKIGMTLVISVYFSINTVLYKLSDQYGWFITTMLQLILIASIVLFRKQIMGFATSLTGGQQKAIDNIYNNRASFADIQRGAVKLYAAKKIYDDVSGMRDERRDKKLTKEYEPLAKDYMSQRYATEKREAEERAKNHSQKAGKEKKPQYSDFVNRVNTRIDKGFTPFDERDIKNTTEMMKELHRQGNDPKNLMTTKIEGNNDERIRLSQHDLESSVEHEKAHMTYRSDKNRQTIDRVIKSDRESRLYSLPTALKTRLTSKTNINENGQERNNITQLNRGFELNNNNRGALEEIRAEKADREFNEMKKKNDGISGNRAINKKVVNGEDVVAVGSERNSNESGVNKNIISNTGNLESTVGNVERIERKSESEDVNVSNENNVGTRKNVETKNITTKDTDITKSNQSTVSKVNEEMESISNVAHEKSSENQVEKVNENINNITKKQVENVNSKDVKVTKGTEKTVTQSNEKNEAVSNVTKEISSSNQVEKINENINNSTKKQVENISNKDVNVTKGTEKTIIKNEERSEVVSNTTHETSSINQVNKVDESINTSNKKQVENVINESVTEEKVSERKINRQINNTENVTNNSQKRFKVRNREITEENIKVSNKKDTLNNDLSHISEIEDIFLGGSRSNESHMDRIKNIEDNLARINKIIKNDKS